MPTPQEYAELDKKVFAELDRMRALRVLIDQATIVCCSEGCAFRWEHTPLCNEMWRAVASMKARAA